MAKEQHGGKGQDNKSSDKKLSSFSQRHMIVLSDNLQSDNESVW